MSSDMHEWLAGYVDGELSEEQRRQFEEELERNPKLREELEAFQKLQEVTGMARYADLPDEVWESYWANIYRRLERGIGWIVFSAGAIILLLFGLYHAMSSLYAAAEVPLWIKIGVTGVLAGTIILLVSYGRERLFAYNRDRYKEVKR